MRALDFAVVSIAVVSAIRVYTFSTAGCIMTFGLNSPRGLCGDFLWHCHACVTSSVPASLLISCRNRTGYTIVGCWTLTQVPSITYNYVSNTFTTHTLHTLMMNMVPHVMLNDVCEYIGDMHTETTHPSSGSPIPFPSLWHKIPAALDPLLHYLNNFLTIPRTPGCAKSPSPYLCCVRTVSCGRYRCMPPRILRAITRALSPTTPEASQHCQTLPELAHSAAGALQLLHWVARDARHCRDLKLGIGFEVAALDELTAPTATCAVTVDAAGPVQAQPVHLEIAAAAGSALA